MVTGGASTDTVGPGPFTAKRRRRKEHLEDEDSSDLSDESDDDAEGTQRAAQQIKFAKMPVRRRSGSSPIRTLDRSEGPEVLITSPSRRSTDSRFRGGSLGAVEAVKARERRDTTTSSEMSSENELDPSVFQRRQIKPGDISEVTASHPRRIDEEDGTNDNAEDDPIAEDSGGESVGSALSSEFGETIESGSLLETVDVPGLENSSPVMVNIASASSQNASPKKTRTNPPALQALPPPRPISVVKPISALTSGIRAKQRAPANPIEQFASLSGKGSPNPLWIKIYTPFSEDPEQPIEMPIERFSKEGGSQVTVAEAIGLALWRYSEEKIEPKLEPDRLNVNKWTLRMVEDGEVDYDFPPLGRTRPFIDFTSNNNRGARGRSREKPFDEFALVEAMPEQVQENEKFTPHFTPAAVMEEDINEPPGSIAGTTPQPNMNLTAGPRYNPVLGQPFSSALNNATLTPADLPAAPTSHATPRMGVMRTLRIQFLDLDVVSQVTTMELASDSYLAEILDFVCKRWNLDKANYILKVSGTNTVAPLDRTIEALGTRSELDLVRRRFAVGPLSLTGSPGSSSPNAPLLIDIEGPKKGKKGTQMYHPLAQKQDIMSSAGNFKRYNVVRKQPMSFSQANQKVLAFDGDYMHIMPGDTGKTLFDSGTKSTSIAFNDVVGCKVSRKHPKIFRVVVWRVNESKRYDFEAKNALEAAEIVDEIKKVMKPSAQGKV